MENQNQQTEQEVLVNSIDEQIKNFVGEDVKRSGMAIIVCDGEVRIVSTGTLLSLAVGISSLLRKRPIEIALAKSLNEIAEMSERGEKEAE